MRERDVVVGECYAVKVSERIVPVRIIRRREGMAGWLGINLRTGRDVVVRSAQRLRYRLERDSAGQWRAVVHGAPAGVRADA